MAHKDANGGFLFPDNISQYIYNQRIFIHGKSIAYSCVVTEIRQQRGGDTIG